MTTKKMDKLFNTVTFDEGEFSVYFIDIKLDRLFSFSLIPESVHSTLRS